MKRSTDEPIAGDKDNHPKVESEGHCERTETGSGFVHGRDVGRGRPDPPSVSIGGAGDERACGVIAGDCACSDDDEDADEEKTSYGELVGRTLGGNGNETEDEEGEHEKESEDDGGVRESEASDETCRTEGMIGVLNVMSEGHRPVSESFNTLPDFDSQAQSLALLQPLSDITLDMPSFSISSDFSHLPPKHHASHSAIMPSLSFPAPNHTTSQVNIEDGKSPAIGMNGPFSFGLLPMRSSPQSPQAPNLFLQSQVDLPLSHSLSVVQMPSQKNSMLGGRQTPLSHWSSMSVLGMGEEKMNETAQLRAEAKKRKEEERRMKELEEEKQRKTEEKVKVKEEVRQKKEEQAALLSSGKATADQKGFVRNVVEDDKWEEKMEMDEARLRDMHMHLPDPVTKGTDCGCSCDGVELQDERSEPHDEWNSLVCAALSEFLLIRFLFPLANVTPTDPNITFARSTNPVFKGFEHTSTDCDLIPISSN
ncbi:hypothetical protein BLNAU_16405 [Blattamonas nauphoetae]|uniref:Uncharacterized protein n=1 Tax=Blattamonas nauphoetae TaxID=2049346 RepID=A0ABQ9XAF2_9EUKA|nr:hypothetical protein BLNAU_16405 [Blattamonas nauphoetae]